MGRAIRRLVSCYDPITSIVNEADHRTIAAAEDEVDEPPTTEEEIELVHEYVANLESVTTYILTEHIYRQDRRFAAFKLLLKVAPQITELSKLSELEKLDAYITDVRLNLLYIICSNRLQLQEGANSARNDDNSRIKQEVANWLNDAYNPTDRLSPKTRINRGFQHDVCGKLLCPLEVDWDDDECVAQPTSAAAVVSDIFSGLGKQSETQQQILISMKVFSCVVYTLATLGTQITWSTTSFAVAGSFL